MQKDSVLALIGCGNLGRSLAEGWIKSGKIRPEQLIATRRNLKPLAYLEKQGVRLMSDNAEAVRKADMVLLLVKPYNVEPILREIGGSLDPKRHILLSGATGVSLDQLQAFSGLSIPTFRVMPNTAAAVAESVTCVCSKDAASEQVEAVKNWFDAIGETVVIEEGLMEASTILGACGIAYVLRFIRAMVQGGIEIGFDAPTASRIVQQTVKGAASLVLTNQTHPEEEIDKVTTPRGCTITGLNEMEHQGFSSALIRGILSSYKVIEK